MDQNTHEKIKSLGQDHLLEYLDQLTHEQKSIFFQIIDEIEVKVFLEQKKILHTKAEKGSLEPFTEVFTHGNQENIKLGKELIANGKVGCLLVAGGIGSRLGFHGPKGAYPVTKILKKSLFQIFAEKVRAASKQADRKLMLAIMTSTINHGMTINFFEEHNYFGLDSKQVSFFPQGLLPLLNDQGNLFLDKTNKLAMGPDGNGSSLYHFVQTGIWKKWHEMGIEYVNFVLIDNPLAEPFDPEPIGLQKSLDLDVAIKCIKRDNSQESVGVLVKKDKKASVIEYFEFPEEEKNARKSDGTLKYCYANVSLFSFKMEFIKKISQIKLPYHIANKLNAWKFEHFIFDVLPYANKIAALLYPREECFAPLKNGTGDHSLESVQKALQIRDRQILSNITGKKYDQMSFELAQDFYYPTNEIINKWKDKEINNNSYIEKDTVS